MNISVIPFSLLRQVGETFYLSGELGFNGAGEITGDVALQTETALWRIDATLADVGLSRRDIVSSTCYLVRKEGLVSFNRAYRTFVSEYPLPVRTTVIADLVLDAPIEISVIAHLPAV